MSSVPFEVEPVLPELTDDEPPANTQPPRSLGRGEQSPYTNARTAWNSHVGQAISDRNGWKVMCFALVTVVLLQFAAYVALSSRSTIQPYIVEVDQLGRPFVVAPALPVGQISDRVLAQALSQWVADARVVTPDVALLRDSVYRMYALIEEGSPAMTRMDELMRVRDPVSRAESETVIARVRTVLRASPSAFELEWTETTRNREGNPMGAPTRWRAIVTVSVVPPVGKIDIEVFNLNPFGVRITDFSFSEVRA